MKKPHLSYLAAGLLAALAGCNTSTFESRIKENQFEFTKLPEIDQQIIRNGFIKIGICSRVGFLKTKQWQ
jgi:hypothetical protein